MMKYASVLCSLLAIGSTDSFAPNSRLLQQSDPKSTTSTVVTPSLISSSSSSSASSVRLNLLQYSSINAIGEASTTTAISSSLSSTSSSPSPSPTLQPANETATTDVLLSRTQFVVDSSLSSSTSTSTSSQPKTFRAHGNQNRGMHNNNNNHNNNNYDGKQPARKHPPPSVAATTKKSANVESFDPYGPTRKPSSTHKHDRRDPRQHQQQQQQGLLWGPASSSLPSTSRRQLQSSASGRDRISGQSGSNKKKHQNQAGIV
mmetsp:Transcript_11725/g.23791  ORF Transcript_11725/g.23791 Transcript_11725/m.23791 type:complete len:260 (+) Transcript_11725:170-949(+)